MADQEINNGMDNMEEEDRVFEFIDENGDATLFEHLATVEHEGAMYLVLTTPENEVEETAEESNEADEEEEMEIQILKIEQDEQGEDIYVSVDDDEAQAVFDKFIRMIDEAEQ